MFKKIVRFILRVLFRLEIKGLENFNKAKPNTLIIANHVSLLDAVFLSLFLPENIRFAINTQMATRWFVRPLLHFADYYTLDPTNPMATKHLVQELKKGRKCMIFPEGRITLTGRLMKIYQGPAMIADKADADILPIHIKGLERTYFAMAKGKVKRCLFPKVTLTILPPTKLLLGDELKGKTRRQAMTEQLYTIMSDMAYQATNRDRTLFETLLEQTKIQGRKHIAMEDATRKTLNYGELLTRVFLLGNKIAENTQKGEYVGILLPNTNATMATFFGLQAFGRVPAMLNFSSGAKNISSVCTAAQIKNVYTSHAFIKAGNLYPLIEAMEKLEVKIHYLEDLAPHITAIDKIKALVASYFPRRTYENILRNNLQNAQSPAVVLFTSGSEGTPKGVVLSYKNILTNIAQLTARVDLNAKDIIFNALPVFHSFGLTGGALLPLLTGIKTVLYPSPLHYRTIPELIYDTSATIMFGTDTFLAHYGRYANPYDFYAVRYVFSGAEKLKDSTRELYAQKYGVRIFEAYGTTETAPGLTINTPMHNKLGTVGKLLPTIEYSLEKVDGIDDDQNKVGKLLVKGDNIMLGYLFADRPAEIIPPQNNIYDTGDIVSIDDEGFVSIKGRVKRFAKIGGEMISLGAVEEYINSLWKDSVHAVLNVPDPRRGEALLLLTTKKDASREEIIAYAKSQGIAELAIPKKIKVVGQIPLLGTGKVDYVKLKEDVLGYSN